MVGSSSGKDQGSLPVEVASPGFGIDGGGCLANARRDRRYEWEDFGDDDFEVLVDEIELEAARRILDRHEPRRRIFECIEASQDATAAIKGEFGW